jgi:hypothetical protein
MRNSRLVFYLRCLAPFVIVVVIGHLAIAFNWSLPVVYGVFLGGWLGISLIYRFVYLAPRMSWLRRLNRVYKRLHSGDGEAVIAELTARRAAGDHSFETAMQLAAAYSYQGRGVEAEPLAHEVIAAVEARGACKKRSIPARALCYMAMLTLFDAWITQGRYVEAANYVRPRIPHTLQPHTLTVLIAWAFFLAGDSYNARAALSHAQFSGGRFNPERRIYPKHRFIAAYMWVKLANTAETRATLLTYRDQLAAWEDSATRNAGNPYGARLAEILEDVRAVLSADTSNQ